MENHLEESEALGGSTAVIPEHQEELEKSDHRMERVAQIISLGSAVLALGGFIFFLGYLFHENSDRNNHQADVLDSIMMGKPGTRMECTVAKMSNPYAAHVGRFDDYRFRVEIFTKECGKLSIDSEKSAMNTPRWSHHGHGRTAKEAYFTKLYHDIQVGQSYQFWVDNSKAKEPQIYKAVPSE